MLRIFTTKNYVTLGNTKKWYHLGSNVYLISFPLFKSGCQFCKEQTTWVHDQLLLPGPWQNRVSCCLVEFDHHNLLSAKDNFQESSPLLSLLDLSMFWLQLCVCVCEREKEKEREREIERYREIERACKMHLNPRLRVTRHIFLDLCVQKRQRNTGKCIFIL